MALGSYQELTVWQKAMQLVRDIYTLTEKFPKSEIFGLTAQMRRSAVSIPSNIAEGSKRGSRKDYRNFLMNAFGSGAELETQLEISRQLNFGSEEKRQRAEKILNEVMRMLNRITSKLKEQPTTHTIQPEKNVPTTYNLQPTT